jgi:hypothetical protein
MFVKSKSNNIYIVIHSSHLSHLPSTTRASTIWIGLMLIDDIPRYIMAGVMGDGINFGILFFFVFVSTDQDDAVYLPVYSFVAHRLGGLCGETNDVSSAAFGRQTPVDFTVLANVSCGGSQQSPLRHK